VNAGALFGLLLRHALTFGAGALVASGHIDPTEAETVVGAGMALGAVGWSWWQKKRPLLQRNH
jgi:hypothetical protein